VLELLFGHLPESCANQLHDRSTARPAVPLSPPPTVKEIFELLLDVNRDLSVVFPAHARTHQRIVDFGLDTGQLRLLDPKRYIDFLVLQTRLTVVITGSGGI